MFFIKKKTFFFFRGLLLQNLLIKKGFLAFFDGFDSSFTQKMHFFNKINFYKFNVFFLSSNFISFFVNRTGLTLFFFFKPSVFLVHGFILSDFFNFNQDVFSFFLIGFSFNNFFFNNFFFNNLSKFFFDIYKFFSIFFLFFKIFFCYYYYYLFKVINLIILVKNN